jgi:hypothetical protein
MLCCRPCRNSSVQSNTSLPLSPATGSIAERLSESLRASSAERLTSNPPTLPSAARFERGARGVARDLYLDGRRSKMRGEILRVPKRPPWWHTRPLRQPEKSRKNKPPKPARQPSSLSEGTREHDAIRRANAPAPIGQCLGVDGGRRAPPSGHPRAAGGGAQGPRSSAQGPSPRMRANGAQSADSAHRPLRTWGDVRRSRRPRPRPPAAGPRPPAYSPSADRRAPG